MSGLVLKYLMAFTEKVWQMLKLDHSIKILALYLEKNIPSLKICQLARITVLLNSLHSLAGISLLKWQVNCVYISYSGPDSINTTIHASLCMPIIHASLLSCSLKWVTTYLHHAQYLSPCSSLLIYLSHLLIFYKGV